MLTKAADSELLTGRKSQKVCRALRDELEAGRFSAGQQFHTISEICDAFNISATTAVKCLDRLVDDGILIRKQGAGTFVKEVPLTDSAGGFQKMSAKIPRCLDYVMPDDMANRIGREYLGTLLAAVQQTREDDDLTLRVNLLPSRIRSASQIEEWLSNRVQGGAQAFVIRWMPRAVQEVLIAKRWPVCIHGRPDAGIELPYVDLDQEQVGQRIADCLIANDCRRVGVLMRAEWRPGDNLMVNSLLERLGSRFLAIESSPSDDVAVDASVRKLLARKPGVDALVVRSHPGSLLLNHLYDVSREHKRLLVVSDWAWHPLVTPVMPNVTTVIHAITRIVTQLIDGERPDPYSVELEVGALPTLGGSANEKKKRPS